MAIKESFLKTYANLPQGSREEIIAVVRDEPYTWKSAKLEVEQNTPIGQEILSVLMKFGIVT
jgi:hypothetical protein